MKVVSVLGGEAMLDTDTDTVCTECPKAMYESHEWMGLMWPFTLSVASPDSVVPHDPPRVRHPNLIFYCSTFILSSQDVFFPHALFPTPRDKGAPPISIRSISIKNSHFQSTSTCDVSIYFLFLFHSNFCSDHLHYEATTIRSNGVQFLTCFSCPLLSLAAKQIKPQFKISPKIDSQY